MSTIRVAKRQRFAVVDRRAITDDRLSWAARGLLVWALDKPDDFELTREQIAKQAPEGETAVRRILKELAAAGYLVRERKRDDLGQFYTETTLYEVPPEPPLVGNPPAGDPPVENPPVRDRRPSTETTANAVGSTAATKPSHTELFKALAESWTQVPWPMPLTDKARGYIASALPDLIALEATPDDVRQRADVFRATYDKPVTPAALVKHWPSLVAPSKPTNGHVSVPFAQRKADEERARAERQRLLERLVVE